MRPPTSYLDYLGPDNMSPPGGWVNVKCMKIKWRWGLLFSLYPGDSRFSSDLPSTCTFALLVANGGCTDILALTGGDSLILVSCKCGICEWKKMSLDRTSL